MASKKPGTLETPCKTHGFAAPRKAFALHGGMQKKFFAKSQAGLEYLLTYGWALVAIATIIGLLAFLAQNPDNNTCQTTLKFICQGVIREGDTVIMRLQNITGQIITIDPFTGIAFDGKTGYAVIIYRGQEYMFGSVAVGAGDTFEIRGNGRALAGQLSITYKESQTGYTKTETIKVGTDAPPDTEISNDGIDNDGDGLIDCENTALIPCEYPVEVTGPTGSTLVEAPPATPIPLTFQSGPIDALNATTQNEWDIKSAYIYFYAEDISVGNVKAQIENSQSDNDIVAGWNSVKIENFSVDLDLTTLPLSASSGSFEIAGANSPNPPKLVISLQKSGGGE